MATFFSFGCTAARPAIQYSGIPEVRHVENEPLIDRPDKEPLSEVENYAEPLPRDTLAPQDGILLSPEKLARYIEFEKNYDLIRGLYERDRLIWKQQRIYYEETIRESNKEIIRLTPTWWDANKLSVGIVGGILIGVGTSLGILYGIGELK